jgi:hypothetical protein
VNGIPLVRHEGRWRPSLRAAGIAQLVILCLGTAKAKV